VSPEINHLVVLSVERGRSVALGRTVSDLGAGVTPSLHTSGRSAPDARTVYDSVEGRLLWSRLRSRLLEGTSSRRKDPRVCLDVGRPPNTPLVDIEPKRGEDSR
jgi:hypothetical protein